MKNDCRKLLLSHEQRLRLQTDEGTSDYYHTSGKPAKDSDADTDADALM